MASRSTQYVSSTFMQCGLQAYSSPKQYEWTLTTARSPAVDTLFALAKARLPTALETKFAEFPAAIVETHGKDLTVSADPSRQGSPAPAVASNSGAPKASAPKPAPKKPAAAVNTATVTVDATFMAAADDLFDLLTNEQRIPAWTRAPAKVRAAVLGSRAGVGRG